MIAKRSSQAPLISNRAPELKKSDLYGDFQELKEMIGEYRESLQSASERCGQLLENIGVQSGKCCFLKRNAGESFSEKDLDFQEEQLYEYENSLITDGLHKISQEEISGLLHGLNGRYVQVGTAGDVVKNQDILPSVLILVQFDPRLVSTMTDWERGQKAGRNHT